ncbi:MAG: hypothetical protein LBJ32_04365 [Oscillospiraceae bacterium]|nr:hypothetical protein [Oscillospiraceae bacterium]
MCDGRQQGSLALAFGIGLIISFLFPEKFIAIMIAILVLILAFLLIKNC